MSRYRRVSRDANHNEIAQALKGAGCSVIDSAALGGAFPDLVVGRAGVTFLLEIKSGDRARWAYADEAHQRLAAEAWSGGVWARVTSVAEALRAVGLLGETPQP